MLQFLSSHIIYVYVIAGIAVIFLIVVLRILLKRRKIKRMQKEMSTLQKRNEALNETLRNPKVKASGNGTAGPMEIQWDDKVLKDASAKKQSMMIELIEFSAYSRRKYLFPAGQTICIGSGADNQLVLQREGVATRHCEIFSTGKALAARNVSNAKALLIRGKNSAFISDEGVFLNNGDHIRIGSADIQFRCFKA